MEPMLHQSASLEDILMPHRKNIGKTWRTHQYLNDFTNQIDAEPSLSN